MGVLVLIAPHVLANDPPTQPTLTYPTGAEQLGERTNVSWLPARDPDGDLVHYVMEYSANGGADWNLVDNEIGRKTRFVGNLTEIETVFDPAVGGADASVHAIALPKSAMLVAAQVNISGAAVVHVSNSTWKATQATLEALRGDVTRVWINFSGKINQAPFTLTRIVFAHPLDSPPIGRRNMRVCTASNMTDSSCQRALQQTFADCDIYSNCRDDPDFNYAQKYPLNVTMTSTGEILMFEMDIIRTFTSATPSYEGINLGVFRSSLPELYYPDAKFRIEYDMLNISYPSQITIDIGNDGVPEHMIRGPLTPQLSPLMLNLDRGALQNLLSNCRETYRGECTLTIGINASTGAVTLSGLRLHFNATSYFWITNFLPLGTAYKLRIKASDGFGESASSSSGLFGIAYPTECEQIPTSSCNISVDTIFFYGDYDAYGLSFINNNTALDCNGARLRSTNPSNDPDIGISVARQQNINIENCFLYDYHTAITSQMFTPQGSTPDHYPRQVYNISIVNNTFEGVEYAAIHLFFTNRTVRGINYLSSIDTRHLIKNNKINVSSDGFRYFGIVIERYANTVIENNDIFSDVFNPPFATDVGYISLNNARKSRVLSNRIKNALRGISIYGVARINETSGNTIIYGNNISSSDEGFMIKGFNNIMVNNTLLRNNKGIVMATIALNNYMYANRMFDNVVQAVDDRNNTFDLLLMGNLWNDYMNDSQGCRDVTPPFGRCDTPYVIDPDSRDRFPIREGVQFAEGMPEPVYELPPIITSVEAPPVVIAENTVVIKVNATGIKKLEGLNIVVDEVRSTVNYVNPQNIGVSDQVLQYDIDSSLFQRVGNTFAWQTNRSSAGTYPFAILVSDGELTKTKTISVQVLPREAMLTVQGLPRIGTAVNMSLLDPLQANKIYVLAFSFGTMPGIALSDGRIIPLNPDPLFLLTLNYPHAINLVNSVGTLDALGRGLATWTIPAVPQIAGVTLYVAYVTVDPESPNSIGSISPAVPITLLS